MSKLVSVKADSTLDISVEGKLFEKIQKFQAWYTRKIINIPAIFVFAGIDIAGFLQVLDLTITENPASRFVITAALAVAFEFAPLYIGYSICLKCYGLGKRIHNWILIFSCSACVLGIIANIYFRFGTMNIAYPDPRTEDVSSIGLPITVLMCILPIITSLVNLA